jgi:hypothetical protein
MRHSALARAQPAYACRQRPLPVDCARARSCTWPMTRWWRPMRARR